jgi:hypothetical protein
MFNAISYLAGGLVRLAARRCADPAAASNCSTPLGVLFLHLLYTICFASQMTLSSSGRCRWCCWCWRPADGGDLERLEEMRMPVCTFIAMTLVMVWLAGELWFFRPRSGAVRFLAQRAADKALSGW